MSASLVLYSIWFRVVSRKDYLKHFCSTYESFSQTTNTLPLCQEMITLASLQRELRKRVRDAQATLEWGSDFPANQREDFQSILRGQESERSWIL
jgi:hypothetical protein